MSALAVKLDENLSQSHVDCLRRAGHDADRPPDEGMASAEDDVLWRYVQHEGRFFITLDLDFSDVRQFAPGTHAGLLLLRPRNNSRDAVLEILQRVLDEHPLDTLKGCFVVADTAHTRIRRPPAPDSK
jgi:predicted nuclease of predicted toxin-antitoxin system